jgi:hypothetical protein
MKLTRTDGRQGNQARTRGMSSKNSQPVKPLQTSPRTEESRFISFFQEVHRTFHQAVGSAGDCRDRFYRLGDHTIQLRFANAALFPFITPALDHLITQPHQSPALTICLWDNVSTHTLMPPLSWPFSDYVIRGGIHTYTGDRIIAALYGGSRILHLLDMEHNLALYCMHDATQFPRYQVSSPLLTILHWGLRPYGLQLIHAAAVGTPTLGGALIVGKGGSGKSTTALTCLNSEFSYVSDDYCLLSANPIPYAYNLYNTAKLDADAIQHLPYLASALDQPDTLYDGKRLIFVNRQFPAKIVNGFPLRAILVPRITGRAETKVRPTSSATGLRALAPNTMFQLTGFDTAAFETIAAVVKEVPCYTLEIGTDRATIPAAIIDVLSHRAHT